MLGVAVVDSLLQGIWVVHLRCDAPLGLGLTQLAFQLGRIAAVALAGDRGLRGGLFRGVHLFHNLVRLGQDLAQVVDVTPGDLRCSHLGWAAMRQWLQPHNNFLMPLLRLLDLIELVVDDFNILVGLVQQRVEEVHLVAEEPVGLLLGQVGFHRLAVVRLTELSHA